MIKECEAKVLKANQEANQKLEVLTKEKDAKVAANVKECND